MQKHAKFKNFMADKVAKYKLMKGMEKMFGQMVIDREDWVKE